MCWYCREEALKKDSPRVHNTATRQSGISVVIYAPQGEGHDPLVLVERASKVLETRR